jgi:hypothetical protein
MKIKHRCICILAAGFLLAAASPSHAGVYNLFPDPGFSDGYGYFGTITTDGSVGDFTDTSPIIDWSITLITPDALDGVVNRTLTAANSTVRFFDDGGPLTITSTSMVLPVSPVSEPSSLDFQISPDGNFEKIAFFGAVPNTADNQLIRVSDHTEDVPVAFFIFPEAEPFVFAVVPEPSSLALLGLGGVVVLTRRKRA